MKKLLFLFVLFAFITSGCSDSSSSSPTGLDTSATATDFEGTWTGSGVYTKSGTSEPFDGFTMTITNDGGTLTGLDTDSDGDTHTSTGTVTSGLFTYTVATDSIHEDCAGAGWSVTGTSSLDSSLNTLTATWSGNFCDATTPATVVLTLTRP